MSFSLNETEALVKRATYATGYSWGIAEESAKATRWLCSFGFDGCDIVCTILKMQFAKVLASHSPICEGYVWRGKDSLCPLITGTLISDFSSRLLTNSITIRNVAVSTMIIPFVSLAARKLEKVLTLQLADNFDSKCHLNGEDIELFGKFPTNKSDLVISVGGEIKQPKVKVSRVQPNPENWRILNELANLTYAPATEESRKLGAGSESADND